MFNSEVFFTTYSPNVLTAPDPCESGNLGVSRLYRLDMITGEAVYNYNKINDIASTYDNKRAINKDDKVLNRDDRVMELGKGIPSGIVTMIDAGGNITLMVTSSNKIGAYSAPDTKLISPVYWMNW